MEGVSDKKGRRRRILVAAVVLVVLTSIVGVWLWATFLRPYSIRDVMEAASFRPGTEIVLEGTVTGILRENTSSGPRVALELDTYRDLCHVPGSPVAPSVFGDPAIEYRLYDRFRTTLHFQAYRFDGDPAVWAPELACPFPFLFREVGSVWDAVAMVAGFGFRYRGTNETGWSSYEVLTLSGDAFRPDVLPVTLRRFPALLASDPELRGRGAINSAAAWIVVAGILHVQLSGYGVGVPIVDDMGSLADGTSRNGTLRFVDTDANGRVDDDDVLMVLLPESGGDTSYDSYLLQVGDPVGPTDAYVYAGHYLLNGPGGPVEALPSDADRPIVQLRHVGDDVAARVTSTVEVSRVRTGTAPSTFWMAFDLTVNGSRSNGSVVDLPRLLDNGAHLDFLDATGNGRLDPGDRFVVGMLENRSQATLVLSDDMGWVGKEDWIAGLGPFWRRYDFALMGRGTGPYTVDVTVPFWSPELATNRTPRVSLWEDSVRVLDNVTISNGTLGSFPGGDLSFSDADGDGFLSTGDAFVLAGAPAVRYDLRVYMLFSTDSRSVVLGP